jgi:hypothetical protein
MFVLNLWIFPAFFNPFNVAFQKTSDENGHTISLIYPKKSNEIAISFKKHELNQHKFDLSGIFKKFTKLFSKGFSFFSQSSSPTTTETPEDDQSSKEESDQSSSSEVTDESSGDKDESNGDDDKSNGDDDKSGDTDNSTGDTDNSTGESDNPSDETSKKQESSSTGYAYPTPESTTSFTTRYYKTEAISYLPPSESYLPPSRSPLSAYLLKAESPVKVSLSTY